MKAAVTGAQGFIGRNLVVALSRTGAEVVGTDVDSSFDDMIAAVRGADVVFHLAGVNRPPDEADFAAGNVGSLKDLLRALDQTVSGRPGGKPTAVVLSSSTQASADNAYGRSKKAAEEALEDYSLRAGAPVSIYRLPGVFGKWCRPNYNSVVATFCHNIARGLPVTISDPTRPLDLVYVDDVVSRFVQHLASNPPGISRPTVAPVFQVSLGDLAQRIQGFRASRETLETGDMADPLTRRLLGTYVSYIPLEDLPYPLVQRADSRGVLAELLKSPHSGQVFVSRTKPGVTRGNHFHDLKVEKFCVLEGDAVIRFRPILGEAVTEHRVSGTDLKVVDIPPGVTHNIENVGPGEMIVLFWASEILDRERPDTHSCEVRRD